METTALLVKMTSALAVVAGLMFMLIWFLKKINRQSGEKHANELTVLSVIPLMHKRHLGLVQFRNRLLVIGITDQQITLLDSADIQHEGFSMELESACNQRSQQTTTS